MTSSGKAIAHHTLVSELLSAILLPKAVSIVKCDAHTSSVDPVSLGKAATDAAAKKAAATGSFFSLNQLLSIPTNLGPYADLPTLHSLANTKDRSL